ncbi:MAG: extracellular solute-binding protein [Propionibacterium sp.]|nr:extracellular solute-binding protein [Propionibacterium sp.]
MKLQHRASTRLTASVAALGTVTAMGLAACSSGGTSESGNATSGSASGEVAQITYLHRLPDGDGMTKVNDIVARWNSAHPDIQVTATKFDGAAADMVKKLETDINADNGPCLAQLGYGEVPTMYVKGLTEDVTEYAEQYKSDFSEGTLNMMKVGDTVVGLPQDTGPMVYFYNKAEFDKLGISVPTTAQEFIDTAAKTAAEGKYIAVFPTDERQDWMSGLAASAGAVWYSVVDDKWQVNVDSEESGRVASFWQTMLDDKSVPALERWGDAFAKGTADHEIIGHLGAAWEAALLLDTMKDTDNEGEWAVSVLPDFGAGEMSGPNGGSGVAVMKGCQYPEQAMEFNDWFNTQIDDLVTQGLVTAATGAMTTPDAIKAFYGGQDVFATLNQANEDMNPDWSFMPYFSAIGSDMGAAWPAAADGSAPVSNIFSGAQSSSLKALTDAGLPAEAK